MMKKNKTVINLLHIQRKYYEKQQRFHYLTFASFVLILLLDFIIIVYTRAVTLDAYAWAGIIFLFTLIGVEAKQYNEFKQLKESVDDFYLKGEYGGN
jgi:hypothetical protein